MCRFEVYGVIVKDAVEVRILDTNMSQYDIYTARSHHSYQD